MKRSSSCNITFFCSLHVFSTRKKKENRSNPKMQSKKSSDYLVFPQSYRYTEQFVVCKDDTAMNVFFVLYHAFGVFGSTRT